MVKVSSKRDCPSEPGSLTEAGPPWASACLLGSISLTGEMKMEVAVGTKLKRTHFVHMVSAQ